MGCFPMEKSTMLSWKRRRPAPAQALRRNRASMSVVHFGNVDGRALEILQSACYVFDLVDGLFGVKPAFGSP